MWFGVKDGTTSAAAHQVVDDTSGQQAIGLDLMSFLCQITANANPHQTPTPSLISHAATAHLHPRWRGGRWIGSRTRSAGRPGAGPVHALHPALALRLVAGHPLWVGDLGVPDAAGVSQLSGQWHPSGDRGEAPA